MRVGIRREVVLSVAAGLCALVGLTGTVRAQEPTAAQSTEFAEAAKWYFSPSVGMMQFEGDEPVDDGAQVSFRLGYDYSERWSFEAGVMIAPKLDETFRNSNDVAISRLEEAAGEGVHDTMATSAFAEGLLHVTRWKRVDPYLSLGAGLMYYSEDVNDHAVDPQLRFGGGLMYHFNDMWAVRADGRFFEAGGDTEANATVDAGLVWNWGARVAPAFTAVGGPNDTDGDGLTDRHELEIRTDPRDPDTDDDGLTDGQEVLQWKTDPLNPDTDLDMLKDGYDEVKKYGTNPLMRDTDNGGVADGHEVLEDGTNPLDGRDDLMLFELFIEFDYDNSDIKSRYDAQLDVIAKVLRRNLGSTARIEGHADKNKKSKAKYNLQLSERRAKAVLNHIATKGHIETTRLSSMGYGFSRPKATNDPELGNPLNRRVEVYIRKGEGQEKLHLPESVDGKPLPIMPVVRDGSEVPLPPQEPVMPPPAAVPQAAAGVDAIK
jgi:outer membrane protein OmpA-like peptidoglycan-associated protein